MTIKDEILAKVSTFPTLPMMVGKLLDVLDEKDADFRIIAEVIKYDPALTANILKAANSSYVGLSKQVSSLTEASIRLGTRWIFKIALSSLINSALRRPAPGYDLSAEELWKHSIATALMSEILCDLLNIKDKGMIFTSALLHDMGKIILGDFISDSFDNILKLAENEQIPFEEAERRVVGIDHAELGGLIADKWEFPKNIVDSITYHHNPDKAPSPTPAIDIVHISDALSLMGGWGIGREGLHYHPSEGSIKRLSITNSILETATSQLLDAIDEIETQFKEENNPKVLVRG